MRTVLVATLFFGWIAGAALAEGTGPAVVPLAPITQAVIPAAQAAQPPAAKAQPVVRKGRARRGRMLHSAVAGKQAPASKSASTANDALTSCLAMWEPATHMTKQQWARACRRVADRLRDISVQ